MHYCNEHFSSGKKQILKNTGPKQHAFLVDALSVSSVFVFPNFQVFLTTQKGAHTKNKGPFPRAHFSNWAPTKSQRPLSDRKSGPTKVQRQVSLCWNYTATKITGQHSQGNPQSDRCDGTLCVNAAASRCSGTQAK